MSNQRATSEGDADSSCLGPPLDEGEVFAGRYEIRELIGIGGFARVYRAVDAQTGRDVAVKLHSPENVGGREQLSTAAKRFYREARLLARLESPHTVRLRDYGRTADGQLYMVCEFVAGTELKEVLRVEAPLEEGRVRNLTTQILRSLADAHALSILHRDIKPSNVMVSAGDDVGEDVKVLDFGIAKSVAAESERQGSLTEEGVVIGTPRYMSPEQAWGRPLRPKSDLFSVGLLVFEMLAGHSPYGGRSLRAVRDRMRKGPIRLPRDVDAADDLERVTNAMLERKIGDRIASARAALERLGAVGEERDASLDVSPGREDSGVSYPLGLGGHSDDGVRSVDASDETRSETVFIGEARGYDSQSDAVSGEARRRRGDDFDASPTVVDPDVRPPRDRSGATAVSRRTVSDAESVADTDVEPVEFSGPSIGGGPAQPGRRADRFRTPAQIVVTSLVAAGVAGAVSYWSASRTVEPESGVTRAQSSETKTPGTPVREDSKRKRPPPAFTETVRRAQGTVHRGLSAAEGEVQKGPPSVREAEREPAAVSEKQRRAGDESETVSAESDPAGADSAEDPNRPMGGPKTSPSGSSGESTSAGGETGTGEEPQIQPKPIDDYDD